MKLPWWYPPILAYHRVHPDGGRKTPTITPAAFEKQMGILAERWKPVSLAALAEGLNSGRLPARAVAVTFDDGTEDNFTHAFPVLKRRKIPAVIFLITGQIGQPGYLSAEQIRQMAEEGISFGSHGVDHEYLPSLAPADLERTLTESKRAIEWFRIPAEFLSFPGGGYNAQVIEAARAAEYRGACTTNRGTRRFPPDPWALRRITMHGNALTPAGVWLRCCGWYGINRRLRPPS